MTAEKTGLAREFQPIEDRAEALRMLKDGSRTVASAMIWTSNQDHVIHTHLSMFSEVDKHLMVRIPTGFDVRAFEAALVKKGTHECFFSVSLVSANIFFKAKYTGADAQELAFALPETIYKVQRRASLRFPIPEGRVLNISYADPSDPDSVVTRKAIDISAGGLSLLIKPEEAAGFAPLSILHNLTFTLNHRRITVDGEIRHVSELPEQMRKAHPNRKDAWRVGVQFIGMRPADNHAVAAYVFEESRKFFTRFA